MSRNRAIMGYRRTKTSRNRAIMGTEGLRPAEIELYKIISQKDRDEQKLGYNGYRRTEMSRNWAIMGTERLSQAETGP